MSRTSDRGRETPQTDEVSVDVENVGGIDRSSVSFEPGITVLSGRNATNRTSFLQALAAGLGSDNVSLKGDAEEGHVSLTIGDETYERHLARGDGRIETGGNPYLDDPDVADLFAFLFESNEARRAVVNDDDLRDVIMRPVDTAAIEAEIHELKSERGEIEEMLETLEDLEAEVTELRSRRDDIDRKIEDERERLEEKTEAIEELDDVDATAHQEELEAKLDDLRSTRSDLEDVEYDLETARESLSEYRDERSDVEDDLSSVEVPDEDVSSIEADLSELHDRKQRLTNEVNRLQNLIQFNEDQLDESGDGLLTEIGGSGSSDLTDQLSPDEEVVCWTCRSTVERSHVEETLEDLKQLRRSKMGTRREIDAEIDGLRDRKREVERAHRRQGDLESELSRLDRRIEETEGRIDSKEDQRDDLADEVERLEARVEELREEEQSELLERHEEVNGIEFELDRLEENRTSVEAEIERIEGRLEEREELETRREEIAEELDRLRTKVERIEESAIETFNEEMEEVLDRLEYDNIDRVWIERKEKSVREGRRKVSKSVFDLYVVRSSESGAVYEDTVDHLSESEREVVGLVFALAGFLAHEVYETVPFMLLDSLEAIDAERIAALTEYLGRHVDNLVVALLPEDADAVPDEYEYVTDI
jgi:peptidoglycan hydrolase CwlO-like protein